MSKTLYGGVLGPQNLGPGRGLRSLQGTQRVNPCEWSMLVGISEAICLLEGERNRRSEGQWRVPPLGAPPRDPGYPWEGFSFSKEDQFKEWLAGLIDGNGCFQLSKKGYASLEITMELRDKHCLYQVKERYGGSAKVKSGVNWVRYRLHHRKGLMTLLQDVNGLIRNPVRIIQFHRLSLNYGIEYKEPSPLIRESGWLSGFFDADGSVYLNPQSAQIFISVSQKSNSLLDSLAKLYGGKVYVQSKTQSFKWVVYRKEEILRLSQDYFIFCPSRSSKHARLKLIPRYFRLRGKKAHLAGPYTLLGKLWKNFLRDWDKYSF